jgi:RND superfamily putative drug exporter
MFKALADFLNKHSIKVLIVSVIFVGFAGWYGLGVFSHLAKGGLSDQNSESTQVVNRIGLDFSKGVTQVIVLFEARGGQTVDTPAFRQEVQRLLDNVKGQTESIASYYSTSSSRLVSPDHRSTYAALVLPGTDGEQADRVKDLRTQLVSNKVTVSVGGQAAVNADVTSQVGEDLGKAEMISFAVLAVLLVLAFRSVIAALLPLALGGFAILGAFLVTRLITEVTSVSQYAINIITLLGLGLAIDYSLFMVSRFREELHASHDVNQAIRRTMETSGHTVFFSGMTVIASLLCMQVFPIDFLHSMSLGGAAAVAVALLAALLVLPSILRLLGIRIDALSFGSARRSALAYKAGKPLPESESIWFKSGKVVMRFRWVALVVTTFVLLAAGLPFLRAHFSTPDYRSVPEGSQSRTVSEKLARDFGDTSAPLRILYTASDDLTKSGEIAKLYAYMQSVRSLSEVSSTASIVDLPQVTSTEQYQALYAHPLSGALQVQLDQRVHGRTTLIDVNYKGELDAAASQKLVDQIRQLGKPDGVTALVGGGPAVLHDLLDTLGRYIPFGLLALGITLFVLLFLLSRSVVIPLQAIALSALSLGAAFGALVWVFQEGHWTSFLHLTATGSIDATMPVLIFAVAFGLSVDYSVFLYSRIREEYDHNGGDNAAAVLTGLQKTGSIITSAALLLFVVVVAFATGRIPIMQQIGAGLALTVLIDAFVIRMVLVPALMRILNHANWWAPKFLKGSKS